MRCKRGHEHPHKIVMATDNPTEPWGPRPFHCPECYQVRKAGTVSGYWRKYKTPSAAQADGHPSPCKSCFG
jgi:hypothetical protein